MTSVDGMFTQYLLDIAKAQTKMACILENIERKMGSQEVISYGPETVEAMGLILKDISEDVEGRIQDSMDRACRVASYDPIIPRQYKSLYMAGVHDAIRIIYGELEKLRAKEVEG